MAAAARLLLDEAVGDLPPRDERRHRVAVPAGLADADEVRRDAEALVAPQRVPRAPVAPLHLICDPQPARLVRRPHEPLHVLGRQVPRAVRRQHPVQDRARQAAPLGAQPRQRRAELPVAAVKPPVGVVRAPRLHVLWEGPVSAQDLRGECDGRGGDAVVRPVGRNRRQGGDAVSAGKNGVIEI